MRRLSLSLFALVFWAAMTIAAAAADNATITGDGVQMREEATRSAPAVTSLNKGTRVEVVNRTGVSETINGDFAYWYYVNVGDQSGFIFGRYVAIDSASAASFEPVIDPKGPALPFEDWGACPFECCTYREWKAEHETVVRADRDDSAPALFTVRPGEWVTALTGVVIVTVPGRAEVRAPMSLGGRQALPGDVVELFTYQGEGYYKAWFGGQLLDGIEGYGDIAMTVEPTWDWWVEVKNKTGATGWTKQPENFGHKDACAGE